VLLPKYRCAKTGQSAATPIATAAGSTMRLPWSFQMGHASVAAKSAASGRSQIASAKSRAGFQRAPWLAHHRPQRLAAITRWVSIGTYGP
jgi:hypothetical protein